MQKKAEMLRIPIYVVSVKSFEERHKSVCEQMSSLGMKFEFIFQFDAHELDSVRDRFSDCLSDRSASNVLKHFEAFRRIVDGDYDMGLILEDDVLLSDNFPRVLTSIQKKMMDYPRGWLVNFGGADNKVTVKELLANDLLIERSISTAEAYLVDKSGCELRLNFMRLRRFDRQADHQIKLADQALGIKHYWLRDPVASQGSITGMFTSELDDNRIRHSHFYNRHRYKWNRVRNQFYPRLVSRVLSFFGISLCGFEYKK